MPFDEDPIKKNEWTRSTLGSADNLNMNLSIALHLDLCSPAPHQPLEEKEVGTSQF